MGQKRKPVPSSLTSLPAYPAKELPTFANLLFQLQDDWSRDWIGDTKAAAKIFERIPE